MELPPDPYRAEPAATGRCVLARRSNAALLWKLALSTAGVLTPLAVSLWPEQPSLVVLALFVAPVGLFGVARTLHAWTIRHEIVRDEHGLHLAWAQKCTALPWMMRRDHHVPWAALRGVKTSTYSVNGVSDTSLLLLFEGGSVAVPDDLFDRSAAQIQGAILDHLDLGRVRPAGSTTAFAERCRERYATALRLRASAVQLLALAGLTLFVVGGAIAMLVMAPFWLTWAMAAVAVVSFGILVVASVHGWYAQRVLVLRADGLAIGPVESRARLIRWDDIRLVRREVTNGTTDGLEIVEHDGTRTALRLVYGRSYDELARVIDPQPPV